MSDISMDIDDILFESWTYKEYLNYHNTVANNYVREASNGVTRKNIFQKLWTTIKK